MTLSCSSCSREAALDGLTHVAPNLSHEVQDAVTACFKEADVTQYYSPGGGYTFRRYNTCDCQGIQPLPGNAGREEVIRV